MDKQNIDDSGHKKYNSILKKFIKFTRIDISIIFIFVLFSLHFSNCNNKQNLKSIICDENNTYWDLIAYGNKKIESSGLYFTRKDAAFSYQIIENKYRILDGDCRNSDLKGCLCWSLSQDSVLKTYIKGGIELIQMKIIKCNSDTILGYDLNGKGVVLFVRVKDLNSIVKQGDPRRKELLKGTLTPLDL